MPRYTIRSADRSFRSTEVLGTDAGAALHIVSQLEWPETDVLQDDRYLFSTILNRNGVWCIFQRNHMRPIEDVTAYG